MSDTPAAENNTHYWTMPGGNKIDEEYLTWIEIDGRFTSVKLGNKVYSLDKIDFEEIQPQIPGKHCGEDGCAQRFPSSFGNCPDCGQQLVPMLNDDNALWSFPGGAGDGLLNVEFLAINAVGDPDDALMPAPEGDDLSFVVAGKPRRLFGIDRSNSNVFVFNRVERRWRTLTADRHFDIEMPRWSWAVLAFDGGFVVPGVDGPLVVRLTELGTALAVSEPSPRSGPLIGSPGMLNGVIHCLVRTDTGVARLGYDTRDARWQAPELIAGAPVGDTKDDYFSAPVGRDTTQNTLFWGGRKGYVALQYFGGRYEAVWRPWAEDFTPELRIRPLWVDTEKSMWQVGLAPGGHPQFHKFAMRGAAPAMPVNATHLTAGECSFASGMQVYEVPWREETGRLVCRTQSLSFYMPICGLKGVSALVADCSVDTRRVNPWELLQEYAVPMPARLLVYRRDASPLDMGRTINLANIDQLHPIVFDRVLMVYDRLWNTITSWKLG
jgi:hypothetical protein